MLTAVLSLAITIVLFTEAGDDDVGIESAWTTASDGTSLAISGTRQEQPTPSRRWAPKRQTSSSTPSTSDERPQAPPRQIDMQECLADWEFLFCFRNAQNGDPIAPQIDTTESIAQRPITIADLAQFTPASIAASSEPSNVGIAGMPTNFVASTDVQTRTGALFGAPVTVRFAPVAYVYTYGDGTSSTLTTAGRTWSSLGQAQFTPTPTSHVYERRGTYTAEVDVRYAAEVDVGAGWIPVTGELTSDGIDQQIRIFEARTALVARTCIESPGAPGC